MTTVHYELDRDGQRLPVRLSSAHAAAQAQAALPVPATVVAVFTDTEEQT